MTIGWKPGVLVALLALGQVGCRGLDLWSGVEFVGGSLRLVAEQPVCGCLALGNKTNEPLFLRSDLNGSMRGAAVINPRETRRFRFDWAGPLPEDAYWIRGADAAGRDVDLRLAVQMEAGPSDCEAETCLYDTLLLNNAVEGR